MFRVPFFTFRPDALGILLSSILLLIMYRCPQRVILSAFVTVTLIHTKQILVAIALPIFIYYLLNNTRYAVKYFIACLVIAVAEFVIIRLVFPIYWGASIYSLFTTVYGFSIRTALRNIAIFCRRYAAFILMGFAGVILMLRKKTGNYWTRIKSLLSDMRHEYIMLITMNIISSLGFLLYCARNGGDGIKYCNDMLAPSVIIFSVLVWRYAVSSWSRLNLSVVVLVICCAAFCSLILGQFNYRTFDLKDIRGYSELWGTIQQYDNGKPMYLGMVSSIYLTGSRNPDKDYIYFDDGHIQYQVKTSPHNKISSFLLVDDIYDAGRKYIKTINRMAGDKNFSVIVQDLGSRISEEVLSENYREVKSLNLSDTVWGSFTTKIYVPRQ